MIQVEQLSFQYGKRPILKDLNFEVSSGAFVSVLGPNGVGKSTLFKCLMGINKDYSGHIKIHGKDIKRISVKAMASEVAYIPQLHQSIFNYSVLDMVLMGTSHRLGHFSSPGKRERIIAAQALEQLGIQAYANRSFSELSGGEQQMVLIARALAQEAKILIMDEPTASLDFGNQLKVLSKVRELTQNGYTVLYSCHNPQLSLQFSDDVIALKNGQVEVQGAPDEVLNENLLQTLYQVKTKVIQMTEGKVIIPEIGAC